MIRAPQNWIAPSLTFVCVFALIWATGIEAQVRPSAGLGVVPAAKVSPPRPSSRPKAVVPQVRRPLVQDRVTQGPAVRRPKVPKHPVLRPKHPTEVTWIEVPAGPCCTHRCQRRDSEALPDGEEARLTALNERLLNDIKVAMRIARLEDAQITRNVEELTTNTRELPLMESIELREEILNSILVTLADD